MKINSAMSSKRAWKYALHYASIVINVRSKSINTADLAQPRNHSIVTRPFSSREAGSGRKTNLFLTELFHKWKHTAVCW